MAFPCVYPTIHHHLIHGSETYSYERSIADESEMQNFEILGQKNKSQKSYGFSKFKASMALAHVWRIRTHQR